MDNYNMLSSLKDKSLFLKNNVSFKNGTFVRANVIFGKNESMYNLVSVMKEVDFPYNPLLLKYTANDTEIPSFILSSVSCDSPRNVIKSIQQSYKDIYQDNKILELKNYSREFELGVNDIKNFMKIIADDNLLTGDEMDTPMLKVAKAIRDEESELTVENPYLAPMEHLKYLKDRFDSLSKEKINKMNTYNPNDFPDSWKEGKLDYLV